MTRKLDTSLLLCRSTSVLLSLNDGRGSLNLLALLALAPYDLVEADARRATLLASAPLSLVRADARPPALFALASSALVRAEACSPTLLALAPSALVRTVSRPTALLTFAPYALVRADFRPPALLALALRGGARLLYYQKWNLLQWLRMRWCGQRFAPPHSLPVLLMR